MILKEGWFERQASKAKEEIKGWSTTKREVMLKETSAKRCDSKEMTAIDLSMLADKWPSAIVARESVGEFTGGAIEPKTMANLDSRGEGPEGAIKMGRKIMYPVPNFIAWMASRSKLRPQKAD